MAAGDPLDDAIDAVVRAIDRIARASRPPAGVGAGAADAEEAAPHASLSSTLVAGGWPASPVVPPVAADVNVGDDDAAGAARDAGADSEASGDGLRKKGKKDKAKKGKSDAAAGAGTRPPSGEPHAPEIDAAALAAAHALQAAIQRREAPAELHELVGKIVTRSQQLDDHLVAAQGLRAEISELVTRLAITAGSR